MRKAKDHDDYIAHAPEYARPILIKLRKLFHKACPQVKETLKWNMPAFEHQGVLAGMAAFKERVAFGFWKESLMDDPEGLFGEEGTIGMGRSQIRSLKDLPSDKVLLFYIRQAVELNESGAQNPPRKKRPAKAAEFPESLVVALKKNKKAKGQFDKMAAGYQREYVEWIADAKQDATRERRVAQAVDWIAEGKTRNWKYKPGGK